MNDLLSVGIVYWTEVERISVLTIVWMRAIIHESLLESNFGTESFVITNRPRIAIDLMHVFGKNSKNATLFNHFRILSCNRLDNLEIFHRDEWLHTFSILPFNNSPFVQVD